MEVGTMMRVKETAEDEGCATPKSKEHRIPENLQHPPPPPRKKKPVHFEKQGPPKDGYFLPDELDALFSRSFHG